MIRAQLSGVRLNRLHGTLVATILGSSLAFIDASVVTVILPKIKIDFGESIAHVQWVIHSYGLFLSTLLLLGGALGDHFGRKRIFQTGLIIFLAGSIGCGVAPTFYSLLVARAIQGTGAALLTPESLVILDATFPEDQRARAIGIWSAFSAATATIGPPLGGFIADMWGWRWAFLVNVPIGILTWVVANQSIPDECNETGKGRLDYLGTAVSTLGVGGLILGLAQRSIGFGLMGLGFLVIFLAVERRSPTPMLPLRSFRSRMFRESNAITLIQYMAMGAAFFLLPLHWIMVDRYSAARAGLAVLPTMLAVFALSPVAGILMSKFGARFMLAVGSMLAGLGFFWIAARGVAGTSYWAGYFPGLLVVGVGMATVVTPLTKTALASLGESELGLASGFNNAVARLAGLLGVAIVSWVMSSAGPASSGHDWMRWVFFGCGAGCIACLPLLRRSMTSTQ